MMKNKKQLTALGLSALMAVSLTACSSGSGSAPASSQPAQTGAQDSVAPAQVDKSQRLIVYTNSGSNGRDAWLKEEAASAGYNVEVVQIQGGDLANRIIAEKNNPQADLVFGLNSIEYEKLKKESVLDPWEPDWAGDVDMSLGDPDGYYYPIVIQPLVNMMNADLENPPKDYLELLDPQWNGKYTILNFGGGTGKTMLAGLLVRFQILGPEVGVPYVTEQVAMVTGSKNRDLAVDFANWFGSADTQAKWMKQFGTIPCQPAALDQADDAIKDFVAKVHPQDMDWGFIAENIEQWVEKCELEFLQ